MLSLRLIRKQFKNYFNLTLRHFGAKKDGYGSSGISDKDVDKSKKPIPQGGLKSDGEKKAKATGTPSEEANIPSQGTNSVNSSTENTHSTKNVDNVSQDKVKIIESVANHKV